MSAGPGIGRRATGTALRRELHFAGTASVSIGVMAPTLAMSVTGVAAAASLGRAAVLAFAVAAVAVALVAYGFVGLSSQFAHAGSVYGFVGQSLNPRAGFVAGWALLGTYLVFPPVSIMGVAVFGRALLHAAGIASDADWYPLAVVGWAVIGYLVLRGIRPTTRSVLVFELVSVALILVLVVVIYVRLTVGSAPGGLGLTADAVRLPSGVGGWQVALAATSGFLAFAGFESAGSLGEEALVPRRSIPRAMVASIGFGAVFYVVCMLAQSLGFGTGPAGVTAFRESQAPLGDLAVRYVGTPMAVLLDAGAVLSALGAGLGGVTVASRTIFAFGRDRLGPAGFGVVHAATGVPVRAVAFELTVAFVLLTGFRVAGVAALDVFFYLATLGVLSLLVMYVLTNLAAVRLLWRRARGETVLPLAGVVVAALVLYRNVWPPAGSAGQVLAVIVAAWFAVGVGIAAATRSPSIRRTPVDHTDHTDQIRP